MIRSLWLAPVFALLAAPAAPAADFPPTPVPAGGEVRSFSGEVIDRAKLAAAAGVPVSSTSPGKVPLPGLADGCYQVGLVAESGIHIGNPFGKAGEYVLAVERGAGPAADVARFQRPADPSLTAVRRPDESGREWASWRGFVEAAAPVWLGKNDRVIVKYTGPGSAVVSALWLRPVDRPCDMVTAVPTVDAPDRAFTADLPPKVRLAVTNAGKNPWAGLVRVDRHDLMTRETVTDFVPCDLAGGGTAVRDYEPKLGYGVFRLTVRAADGRGDDQVGSFPAEVTVAHAPAKLAKDLPDDWPLATHHWNPSPVLKRPMPGFKWYRTFISWQSLNPRPNEYDWKNLDATVADVTAAGGKLLLCLEGAPAWTNKRTAADKNARVSHFAPDDWDDARRFAREVVARYDRTAVAAVEPWNEPNANLRWNDDPVKLVRLHQIWFEETRKTAGRMKVVGISISPGHHVEYVESLTEAGILKACDVVAGHFYEELGHRNRLNPRNNLPLHADLLHIPMRREKVSLPLWDTECGMGYEGSNGGPRLGGKMLTQNERVALLRARPGFDPNEPWLMWPASAERRQAGKVVAGMVSLLGHGIEKSFTFHPNWYSQDGALNLPWVAAGCFGRVLEQIDFRYVMPLGVNAVGGPADVGAVAYRLGKPGGP